jgi:uncharacterized protein
MCDLSDVEIARLQTLLDEWAAAPTAPAASAGLTPAPLDASALDGYLCGVLLQPQPVPEAAWLPWVMDGEGRLRTPAAEPPWLPLVRRRHAALAQAIAQRRWFDPWLFELDAEEDEASADPTQAALPWVAGFALAAERFPALMRHDAQALAAPLALLYQFFDADDLEGLDDEPALAAALADTEPAADLAQAAEDLVRGVLMLADISRPPPRRPAAGRTAPARASPGPGPRSKSARRAHARRG